MSLTYGFFDSQKGDRTYEAADFNRLFDGVITDGVFESVGNAFNITSASNGMLVTIDTGRAWFHNTWTYNDSIYPVLIPTAESLLNRIDAIVLEIDKTNDGRNNSIKVVTGTPAYEDPEKPTLKKEDNIYQYALAYVTVRANVSEITDEDIEYVVGNDETPFVTGEIQQLEIENILLEWNSAFDTYFASWTAAKQQEFRSFMQDIVNELSTSQIGQIQTSILKKEDAPVEITATAAKGDTSISITNDAIGNNSFIDVYTDPFGVVVYSETQSGHTITIVFRTLSEDTTFKILVRNE